MRSKQAFITGLPRTRTYWIAQRLSSMFPGVRAHHELLNHCFSREDFSKHMEPLSDDLVVNCDSGLYISDYITRFPYAPIVIVRRPLDEVLGSLMNFLHVDGISAFRLETMLREAQDHLDEIAVTERERVLVVDFNDYDSRMDDVLAHVGVDLQKMSRRTTARNMPTVVHNSEAYNVWRD